jgi:hypothetical protein
MSRWRTIFQTGSSIKPGDYLIITKDMFNGLLGDRLTSLERMRGKVLKILSIDKERDNISLEVPKSIPYNIPYKNWKEYALKFDDVKL